MQINSLVQRKGKKIEKRKVKRKERKRKSKKRGKF